MLGGDAPRPGAGPSVDHLTGLGSAVDLQTLIASRRAGRSLKQLAADSGMGKPTWGTHTNPTAIAGGRLPTKRTMLAIAKGLDVDPEAVGLAVLETMGMLKPGRPRPALLAALPPRETLERLTPEDVDTVVRLVRLLADRGAVRPPAPVPAAATWARTAPSAVPAEAAQERVAASA